MIRSYLTVVTFFYGCGGINNMNRQKVLNRLFDLEEELLDIDLDVKHAKETGNFQPLKDTHEKLLKQVRKLDELVRGQTALSSSGQDGRLSISKPGFDSL